MRGEIEEIKQIFAFFTALSGGDSNTKNALKNLLNIGIIKKKDMGEILRKAGNGLENIAKEIRDKRLKILIYIEAFKAAYLDRKITSKERKALKKIQTLLKLEDSKIKEIERWVVGFLNHLEKGKKIIYG